MFTGKNDAHRLAGVGPVEGYTCCISKESEEGEKRHSRAGRPNPVPGISSENGGWVFTESLKRAHFAKYFAGGSDDPLRNKHFFYCKLCKENVKMASHGISEI